MFELQTPRIATGAAANLTLIDLEREWVVGEHGYASRSDNCCFDGMTFSGTIDLTIAAGGVVHRARATEGAAA